MNNPGLIKNFIGGAAITQRRIVKFGTDDDHVIQGAGDTDLLIGVKDELNAITNERADVIMSGIAEVEYGGNVGRGDVLTSDSVGRAVKLTGKSIFQTVVDGAAAGNVAVAGIKAIDELISVLRADVAVDTGTGASGNKVQAITDLTSEFSITADDTINNASGTDTTGDRLIVTYRRKRSQIGYAMEDGVLGDIGSVRIAPGVV